MPKLPQPPARTALVYDFDGTLAPGNIQEHALLPDLGVETPDFWMRVKAEKANHDADEVLTYMRLLLEAARAAGKPLTAERLRTLGAQTPLFDGVDAWFQRINQYGAEHGLALEHYIVSSGTEEMIRACAVAGEFKEIFGCKYVYDDDGAAVWPATAVNYTTKTQYLFRINKGILNHWDNDGVNRWTPMGERDVPFKRMIFLGDGDTDIPAMKMVRFQGGHSVAVFNPERWDEPRTQAKVHKLISEDRASFVVPGDYSPNTQLEVVMKGILGRIARDAGYRADS
jgi:phosphoserine phosphatase